MEQPAPSTMPTVMEDSPMPMPEPLHPKSAPSAPSAPRPSSRTMTALTKGATNATRIPPGLQAKMAAIASRNNNSSSQSSVENIADAFKQTCISDSAVGRQASAPGVAGRRKGPGLKLGDIVGSAAGGPSAAGLGAGRPSTLDGPFDQPPVRRVPAQGDLGTPFSNFRKIVDPSGALKFGGKAVLHASGVDFSNGSSFAINMGELELHEELGKGNYGTVKKVRHRPTNVLMAMKEIRLELDDSKLNAIIMELDILHRATSPQIVEFYGAFFIESCVYYCMEYMDAGSLDKLSRGGGMDEYVLARIVHNVVKGLKFLKDSLQIIHRDVKPTNMLVNRRGDVKLCDFGVSGQLEKSLAKTNIGCQSYMAPERIKGESQNNVGTYTVSSDVWSLGLSILELAMGTYPYPPETYSNVFAQLTAIVHGSPPEIPNGYSDTCREFVNLCMMKEPEARATCADLLGHPFLVGDTIRTVDMVGWVARTLERREEAPAVMIDHPT
ncbi:kinase-like protein [Hysterangium stoloniferum]|nr:kinase-like protein [Hysterangium stoloniferum]